LPAAIAFTPAAMSHRLRRCRRAILGFI